MISVARFSKSDLHHGVQCKLDIDDYYAVSEFVESEAGVYGLINCVGTYGEIGPFHDVNFERWQRAFNTNFFSVANFCREVLKKNLQDSRKLKRIINFSGGGAFNPMANFSCYSTSKASIVRFTENLAVEYQDFGVTVNAVSPGFIATPIHDSVLDLSPERCGGEMFEHIKEGVDANKGDLDAVGRLIDFLLSDGSDFVTGRTLSAVWDSWDDDKTLKKLLNARPNLYKMVRIDENS